MRQSFLLGLGAFVVIGGYSAYHYYAPDNIAERAEVTAQTLLTLTKSEDVMYSLPPTDDVLTLHDVSYGTATGIPSFTDMIKGREGTPPSVLLRRGALVMPDVNIGVPIFEGTSDASLYWGAGTAKENQQLGEGNYALSAHNYLKVDTVEDWFFSGLQNEVKPNTDEFRLTNDKSATHIAEQAIDVDEGMPIYAYDGDMVYEYHVTYSEAVSAYDTYVLDDERVTTVSSDGATPIITLITCFEQHGVDVPDTRLVVVGELVSTYTWDEAAYLNMTEHFGDLVTEEDAVDAS